MKTKQLKDLQGKELSAIKALLSKKRLEKEEVARKLLSKKEKNVKLLKNIKKDIVQLLTLSTQKEKYSVKKGE